jgi:CheY-like chemotaxis protein
MKSILLVDEDEWLAYSLGQQLETAGYDVTVAASTMATLTVLDAIGEIDLVLTDLVMPAGQPNGLSLGRMARMKRLGIKVAFISGCDIDNRPTAGPIVPQAGRRRPSREGSGRAAYRMMHH